MEKDIKDTEVMDRIDSEELEAKAAEAEAKAYAAEREKSAAWAAEAADVTAEGMTKASDSAEAAGAAGQESGAASEIEGAAEAEKIVEFEQSAAKASKTAPEKKKHEWAGKPVTGKVLAIMLGIALLANAAITAGISAIFANNSQHKMSENGRPGSEMMGGENGGQNGGQMTPPGNGSQSGGPGSGQDQQGQQGQQQSSGPSIGIMVTDDSGVVIAQVTGENAKTAGFQEGDKILKLDDKEVSTTDELVSEVKSHSAGDTVTVTVDRDGQTMEIKTVLE